MRVLIYHSTSYLAPIGGPSGYLYGLNKALEKNAHEDIIIDFLPPVIKGGKAKLRNISKNTKNKFIKKITNIYQSFKKLNSIKQILLKQVKSPIDFSVYDFIHFHNTRDFYILRDELKTFTGKTILTSHSPQPLSNEIIQSLTPFMKKMIGKTITSLIKMDEYAFKNADYIFFPCESADEPYIHEWPEYKDIKKARLNQYRYILTGTTPTNIKTSEDVVRANYQIPPNAFVISYVGRHNEIKGYDRLKRIGEQFLLNHPDAYIIIAGNEEPIKRLQHPHWIEVGWTNDPHSIINSSDVFVLPNKETYFDLIMLEVLSIGKYSLISYTGGNKYFEKFNDAGIAFFADNVEALQRLEEIYSMSISNRKIKEEVNRKVFNDNFTADIFANNYVNLLKSLEK